MLMRSGFFTRPKPLVEFDCGSQSTSSVLTSAAASEAVWLMAVVVLPTPPFWLATAMTRPMIFIFLDVARQNMRSRGRNQCQIIVQNASSVSRETIRRVVSRRRANVFHMKHITALVGWWDGSGLAKPRKCFTWNTLVQKVS